MIEEHYRDISSFGSLAIYLLSITIAYFSNSFLLLKQLILALGLAYVVTIIFRISYFKKRPKPQKYKNFFEKIDASSFPSLHSMRATILAVIFASFFANIFLTIIFTAIAIAVIATRYLDKRHHLIDSIGGALFGLIIGLVAITYAPILQFIL